MVRNNPRRCIIHYALYYITFFVVPRKTSSPVEVHIQSESLHFLGTVSRLQWRSGCRANICVNINMNCSFVQINCFIEATILFPVWAPDLKNDISFLNVQTLFFFKYYWRSFLAFCHLLPHAGIAKCTCIWANSKSTFLILYRIMWGEFLFSPKK